MKSIRPRMLGFLGLGLLVSACAGEPTQSINYGPGFLELEISEAWQPAPAEKLDLAFTLAGDPEVQLTMTRRQQDLGGGAATSSNIKSVLGQEVNRKYGSARTFVTLEGNALVAYAPPPQGNAATFHWVLARPAAIGIMMRTDVALRVPAQRAGSEEVAALAGQLEKQLGNAIFLADRPAS